MTLPTIETGTTLTFVNINRAVLSSKSFWAAAFIAVNQVIAHLALRARCIEAVIDIVAAVEAFKTWNFDCRMKKQTTINETSIIIKVYMVVVVSNQNLQ